VNDTDKVARGEYLELESKKDMNDHIKNSIDNRNLAL